ncbi:18519_t:CDS:2, partial [Acaulospora morrowiae]
LDCRLKIGDFTFDKKIEYKAISTFASIVAVTETDECKKAAAYLKSTLKKRLFVEGVGISFQCNQLSSLNIAFRLVKEYRPPCRRSRKQLKKYPTP